jgi:iron complex outermembrane recepter protein
MKRIHGQLLPIVSASILAWAAADVARAQQENAEQLQEVIVTAQKRVSTVQETPISITAITGESLQERGITDLATIVQSVPGVSMRQSGPGQTELEMRGMTSGGGNSSTVGFYLDDTPLTAPASAQNGKVVIDPNLYDLNRIEVLRGPQGTLYGSGSMGGTIKLIPNAPNPGAFDASGQVILSGTDGGGFNHGENAMVNLPLINDTLAVRIVGSQEHLSGWINRVVIENGQFPAPLNGGLGVPATERGNVAAAPVAATYKDVNDEDLSAVRIALLWKPMDRLTITPSFMFQEITQDGLSAIDSNPGTLNNYQPFNAPEPFLDRIEIGSLNAQFHFDFADLSSTTSYWTRDEELRQDGAEEVATVLIPDFGYFPLYANNNGGNPQQPGVGPNSPTSLENDSSKQISEELRLTSNGDTKFKWLAGYFYQSFESDFDLWVLTPEAAPVFGTTNGFTQIQPTKIVQNSFFGELSYSFLPELTATAGLRRYAYSGTVNTAQSGWLAASGSDTVYYFHTDERNQGLLPKVNLAYQPDKDLMVYATAAKGFRPGGGNQPIPTEHQLGQQCLQDLQALGLNSAPLGFEPDSVWSYELGEKFRNADGRVTLNSAAYFENWEHVQTNIPLACGYPFTGNSGDAHIYGAEVELDTLLAPGLILALNSGWSHARYVAGVVPGTTIDDRVQSVPDWTGAASLSFRHGISDTIHFISRVDYTYMGSRIDATPQPNYLPSYDLTNIRAGVENDHWTAVLFVDNVANKLAKLSNTPAINVGVATFTRTAVAQPLTFGVDVSYRLGK